MLENNGTEERTERHLQRLQLRDPVCTGAKERKEAGQQCYQRMRVIKEHVAKALLLSKIMTPEDNSGIGWFRFRWTPCCW